MKIVANETVKCALLAVMAELYAGEGRTGKRRHILAALQRAMGERVRVSDRAMRRAAQALREEDQPVCPCEGGYYLGTTREEIERAAAYLDAKAKTLLVEAGHLRRIAAGRFGGEELPLWRAAQNNSIPEQPGQENRI